MSTVSPTHTSVRVKIDLSVIVPPESKSPSEEGPLWLVLRGFLNCQLRMGHGDKVMVTLGGNIARD